jgi:hypothetical protein
MNKQFEEAAEKYADVACETTPRKNDGYPLTLTLGDLKGHAKTDFLAGCEYAANTKIDRAIQRFEELRTDRESKKEDDTVLITTVLIILKGIKQELPSPPKD